MWAVGLMDAHRGSQDSRAEETMRDARSRGAFVSRRGEVAALGRALDGARRRHGQVVLVSGEAGIGKTRLVQELAGISASGSLTVLWGRCRTGETSPAYWPWRQPPVAASPPQPVDPTPLPPLSGAATTYRFSEPLDYPVRDYTERSSIVLYESGGCYLQYDSLPGQLRGRCEHAEAEIRFYFSERTSAPDATGLVRGDVLEMRFSLQMQHSDFENAVYRRVF